MSQSLWLIEPFPKWILIQTWLNTLRWHRKWESFVSVSASADILEKEGTGKSDDDFHRRCSTNKIMEKDAFGCVDA